MSRGLSQAGVNTGLDPQCHLDSTYAWPWRKSRAMENEILNTSHRSEIIYKKVDILSFIITFFSSEHLV